MPLKPHPTDPDKMVYVSRQYDLPSQYTWIGLTEEERADVLLALNWDKQLTYMGTAKAIEAKLKELNI